jgi:tetratricopeptide (TPR) repeat protein
MGVYQRTTYPEIDPVNVAGWYEIIGEIAGGKTTLAFLMAEEAMQKNRQTYYFDFRLSHESFVLPPDFSERALLLLDNAHLSDASDIYQLFHQLPKEVSVVAFSRKGDRQVSRYLSGICNRSNLNDSEIQEFLNKSVIDKGNLSSKEQALLEKCISEVTDWEQAGWLKDELILDIKKTLKEYEEKKTISAYLPFLIRKRLIQDGLLDNEVLVDIASFTFIDLPILPSERDREDKSFEIEFATLQRHGWLFRDGTQLSHPKLAEQILRTIGVLNISDEGESLGRRIAKILIRSKPTEARLKQVIRNIRYRSLPPLPGLLEGLYDELLAAPQQSVPLDPVYIHRGSDLRRRGEINRALKCLLSVSKSGRNAIWSYEYAFIPFMEDTEKSLKKAETILLPDLSSGNPKDRFINSGLYALVLSRQGRLEEADSILRKLVDSASSVSADLDAKRWAGNAAIHYCETGAGLVAHGKLTMTELDNRIATAENLSDDPAFKGGSAYIKSLYGALKEDWNSCWKAAKILLYETTSRGYVQQRGVYLALMVVAAPHIGKVEKERTLLKKILALPSEFDNRRAQAWAQIRIREIGSPVDPRMLIRTLYPDITS